MQNYAITYWRYLLSTHNNWKKKKKSRSTMRDKKIKLPFPEGMEKSYS